MVRRLVNPVGFRVNPSFSPPPLRESNGLYSLAVENFIILTYSISCSGEWKIELKWMETGVVQVGRNWLR